MRVLPLSAALILTSLLAAAQDTAGDNCLYARYLMIYAEPLAVLDYIDGPSYRIGLEYPLNGRWSVYGTGGDYALQGYIVRVGIKKYFKQVGLVRYSFSLEYVRNWYLNDITDYYTKDPNNGEGGEPDYTRPVNYQVEKNIDALTFVFARELLWRHHWFFEFYAGIGVKFKLAAVNISGSVQNQLYNFNNSPVEGTSYAAGRYVVPDIRMGIKLGRLFQLKRSTTH